MRGCCVRGPARGARRRGSGSGLGAGAGCSQAAPGERLVCVDGEAVVGRGLALHVFPPSVRALAPLLAALSDHSAWRARVATEVRPGLEGGIV